MKAIKQYLPIVVIICAVVSLAIGVTFIQQGFAKEAFLVQAMQQEQITISGVEGIVDSAQKAQAAGDTVREHRHGIAPTYGDLLDGGRYDPTSMEQLTYTQALNLENYLYLAVLGFGVTQLAMGAGAFMVVTGIALGVTGLVIHRLSR